MIDAVDGSNTFAPTTGIVSRQIGAETVLVDLDGELYFSLNHTGSVVWNALSSGATFRAAVSAVVDAYEVEPSQAEADAARLVSELIAAQLLESR